MVIITNFNQRVPTGLDFMETLPEHTIEALDNYLIKGWNPGGFLSQMIVEDYKTALTNADHANRQRFYYVAMWLSTFAPKGSTGSDEAMRNWTNDKDSIRSAYAERAEKDFEWRLLGGEAIV